MLDVSIMAAQNNWKGDAVANGYVRMAQDGSNALLQVDANGGGDGFVTLARLLNVKASDVTAANIQTLISGVATSAPPGEIPPTDVGTPSNGAGGSGDVTTWVSDGTSGRPLDTIALPETSQALNLPMPATRPSRRPATASPT